MSQIQNPAAAGGGRGGSGNAGRTADDVYRRLAPVVLGYLRAQGALEPEDLLGDVFVRVVKGLPRFRGDDAALRRWVFTIAHARIIDARRRSARRRVVFVAEPESLTGDTISDGALPDPDLVRALAALTPDQRDVVALRFVADLAIRDVARLTGKRPGAVKALQARALDRLAVVLSDVPAPHS